MTFREFLQTYWRKSVWSPWPPGNALFAERLEQVVDQGGDLWVHRKRGRGTTTLLMALLDYATTEALLRYVVFVANTKVDAEHAAAQCAHRLGRRCERKHLVDGRSGGLIEFFGIRQSFRGIGRHVAGQLVRPQLTVFDLYVPRSEIEHARIRQWALDADNLQGPGQLQRTITAWTGE